MYYYYYYVENLLLLFVLRMYYYYYLFTTVENVHTPHLIYILMKETTFENVHTPHPPPYPPRHFHTWFFFKKNSKVRAQVYLPYKGTIESPFQHSSATKPSLGN